MRVGGGRALLVALVLLASCTSVADTPPAAPPDALEGCGPVTYDEVVGRAPSYLSGPLDEFRNDHALCGGLWLPRTGTDYVPQGIVVDRDSRTAWISGYDDDEQGHYHCRVMRVSLRTGKKLAETANVAGRVGNRDPVDCHHGGGLSRDRHGLWLSQRRKIWLLDPDTLQTERVWKTLKPVLGSAVMHDDRGRLGIMGWFANRRGWLHWFDVDDLLAPGVLDIGEQIAVGRRRTPSATQGAFASGPGKPRVRFVRSHTTCGQLQAGRRRVAFIPGAEGAWREGRHLWVVSESTAAPYQRKGGRPVVPQLARFHLGQLREGHRPDCTP